MLLGRKMLWNILIAFGYRTGCTDKRDLPRRVCILVVLANGRVTGTPMRYTAVWRRPAVCKRRKRRPLSSERLCFAKGERNITRTGTRVRVHLQTNRDYNVHDFVQIRTQCVWAKPKERRASDLHHIRSTLSGCRLLVQFQATLETLSTLSSKYEANIFELSLREGWRANGTTSVQQMRAF